MWQTFSRVGCLVLLLCHVVAVNESQPFNESFEAAEAEIGVAAADSQGSLAPGSARPPQRRYRNNPKASSVAGTPLPDDYIVIFERDVDVRTATASARARAVSLVQAASASSSGGVSAASAELAVSVVSVAAAPSSRQRGQAVVRVSGSGLSRRAVRAALSGPQVKAVLQDSVVTVATADPGARAQKLSLTSSSSSSSSSRRRALLQEPSVPAAAAAAAARTAGRSRSRRKPPPGQQQQQQESPSPSPQPVVAAVNCSGHFTDYVPCGLRYAPMWQRCMTYTTYVIDKPAANGGASCPRRTGFKSWKPCQPSECGSGGISPAGGLPVAAVAPAETLNWGMWRIGAFSRTNRTVVDISSALESNEGLLAVVIDSGIDSTHPDLNVVGSEDLVDKPGDEWYNKDGNGHGTHVAGIIGARHNDQGVVGVAPNVPLYAFKVLGADGKGRKSTVLAAFRALLALLEQGRKVAALNLSFTLSNGESPPAPEDVEVTCGLLKQISAYGVSISAAAGNGGGVNLRWVLPAACPDVMAVSAIDQYDYAAYFSNYELASANASLLQKIIAAPGQTIRSTFPTYLSAPEIPYVRLSGTSQAAPFVAGSFVLCLLTGNCRRGNVSASSVNFPVLQALAAANPCGRFQDSCGPSWAMPRAYYGYMLNVSSFLQA